MKSNLGFVGDQVETSPSVAQPRTTTFFPKGTVLLPCSAQAAQQILERLFPHRTPASQQAFDRVKAQIEALAAREEQEAREAPEEEVRDGREGVRIGSPAEQRAFNAGRAFAEHIARTEQNTRRRDLCQMALHGLADEGVSQEAVLLRIVAMLYPDLADLADQDPALARRALNALQPD